jgi:hypothetical protein
LALVAFLDDRVVARWRRHPRTLVAWCDPRTGGSRELPTAARVIAASLHAEPKPFWLPRDPAGQ